MITGAYRYTREQIEKLTGLGLEVDHIQYETDAIEAPEKYDAVICNGLFLSHDIREFKNLRYIQLTSAGLDRVPLDYINEHNIKLHNARGVYSVPMAEYAVLKILELYKHSRGFYKSQSWREWKKDRNITELAEKTAAIVGCGSVGLECAKRLKAFDVTTIGLDIYKGSNGYIDRYELIADIENVLPECDIVVLTLPLTNETRHLFSSRMYKKMKNTAILVNISRGGVVDQAALINALQKDEIAGAALDVFEEEPLTEDSPLWDMDNVLITPHNSFVGDGNHRRMFEVIYKNLKEWVNSEDNGGVTEE